MSAPPEVSKAVDRSLRMQAPTQILPSGMEWVLLLPPTKCLDGIGNLAVIDRGQWVAVKSDDVVDCAVQDED